MSELFSEEEVAKAVKDFLESKANNQHTLTPLLEVEIRRIAAEEARKVVEKFSESASEQVAQQIKNKFGNIY